LDYGVSTSGTNVVAQMTICAFRLINHRLMRLKNIDSKRPDRADPDTRAATTAEIHFQYFNLEISTVFT